MSSPVVIELTPAERDMLLGWTSRPTAQNRQRIRAQIVLLAADGWANQQISRHLGRCEDTVRKWRGRFAVHRVKGLADQPRSGRPRKCTALQTAQVKAIACSPPADRGLPLARWSVSQITRQALAEGVITAISRATVARYLAADAIKPWQYRSWISPTDPDARQIACEPWHADRQEPSRTLPEAITFTTSTPCSACSATTARRSPATASPGKWR